MILEDNAAVYESPKKKSMKKLTCRKCEGHGINSILKGHAASCPFNNCTCDTCSSVMNMRANALIRRFRHRQPNQNSAVLKTIRSKNGNMRLRIVPKSTDDVDGTMVTYDNRSHSILPPSGRTSSTSFSSPSPPSTVSSSSELEQVPIENTNDLLIQLLNNYLLQQLLNNCDHNARNPPLLANPLLNFPLTTLLPTATFPIFPPA
ncbi:unnamed protein product [Caenorhabditis bovis]|uniref:DM domain-containing protein n=1 Tax=Caenorhabditis bovis TaxID=2654633 RepID=A0A8S1F3X8_9PELO|nr:unnamed protein product [Caenorhabditis bovis]